jgi:hypothetical protein
MKDGGLPPPYIHDSPPSSHAPPSTSRPPGFSYAIYHCVSRIVNRDMVLGEAEKEQFVKYMRLYARLYGFHTGWHRE